MINKILLILLMTNIAFADKESDTVNIIQLTKEEIEYIKEKKVINICLGNDQIPITIKQNNKYRGIAIDFLKIIAKDIDIKVNYIDNIYQKDYFNNTKNGKCDLVSAILTKPNVHDFLTPTVPYVSDYIVLSTLINKPYISDLSKLKDEKIMIQQDSINMIRYIKYLYPNLNLIGVNKIDLKKIENGDFYGVINPSYFLAHNISNNYPNILKIMTKVSDKNILASFGISNREPLLLSIFNKSLNKIPIDKKEKIYNIYKKIKVEKQIDYKLIFKIIAISSLIILIIFISYIKQRKLRKEIQILNKTLEVKIQDEIEKNKIQQTILFHQSRLAQMGEMIAMIAHQWRQPLTIISNLSTKLKLQILLETLDDKTTEKVSNEIVNITQHLSNTINDFRNFFKTDKVKLKTTYKDIVEETLSIVKVSIEAQNINLIVNINHTNLIFTFKNEVKQVLLNLIKNAEDILLNKKIKNPTIMIKSIDECLIVSDNAGGVPLDIIDKIFDPYFSTKKQKDGTGLGLYMSKTIIDDHCSGKLTVSNNKDGAVFKIKLK